MRLILVLSLVFLTAVRSAHAYTIPSFPSCSSPVGSVKVAYNSGTHGIVGNQNTFTGSDTVYQVSADTLIQCFCPSAGSSGIQTNWWKINTLSDQDIRSLESRGWYYIPTGDVWGLEKTSYLATNLTYSCATNTSTTSVSSDSDGIGGGDMGMGDVLGLAATGNLPLIYAIMISGILSFMFGVLRIIKSQHEERTQ